MDDFLFLDVTYAALERAFQRLGFRISVKETHRLYEHDASGSIHAMPLDISMDQPVRPAHLSSARHAVVAFKIADEARLIQLLTESEPSASAMRSSLRSAHAPRPRKPSLPAAPGVEAG